MFKFSEPVSSLVLGENTVPTLQPERGDCHRSMPQFQPVHSHSECAPTPAPRAALQTGVPVAQLRLTLPVTRPSLSDGGQSGVAALRPCAHMQNEQSYSPRKELEKV